MNNIVKLKGEQCKVLYLQDDKDHVILGVAGSGKSVEAIYRAILMSLTHTDEKIYLFCFNSCVVSKMIEDKNTVIEYLKNLSSESFEKNKLNDASRRIIIIPFYTYMKEMLNKYCVKDFELSEKQKALSENSEFLDAFPHYDNSDSSSNKFPLVSLITKERNAILESAITKVKEKYPDSPFWKRSFEFISDEIAFLQENYVTTVEEYININRTGRNSTLLRDQRPMVYELFETYKSLRNKQSYSEQKRKYFDFNDIYWYGNQIKAKITPNDQPKYIIIDEVQDFTPAMFDALNKIARQDAHKMVLGDLSQNIFGRSSSWSKSGININKRIIFNVNYRNKSSIGYLAKCIQETKFFKNEKNTTENDNFITPVINDQSAITKQKVYDMSNTEKIFELIEQHPGETLVIVFKGKKDLENKLNELYHQKYGEGGKITDLANLDVDNRIKGLECKNVIIYGLNDYDVSLDSETNPEFEDSLLTFGNKAISRETYAKKIYVSVTRAKEYLSFFVNPDKSFPVDIIESSLLDFSESTLNL